jgi:hypothetical protein
MKIVARVQQQHDMATTRIRALITLGLSLAIVGDGLVVEVRYNGRT